MTTKSNESVPVVTSYKDLTALKAVQLRELIKTLKAEDEDNEILNSIPPKMKKQEVIELVAQALGFTKPIMEIAPTDAVLDTLTDRTEETGEQLDALAELLPQPSGDDVLADLFNPEPPTAPEIDNNTTGFLEIIKVGEPPVLSAIDQQLAELTGNTAPQVEVIESKAEEAPETKNEIEPSVDDVLAQLGLPSEPPAPPAIQTGGKAEDGEKPLKPKKPRVTIPIDAPIPIVKFRDLLIGVYGNILEELEEQDENGYTHYEVKLERFNPKAHESFRKSKGNMVLLYTQNGSTYLVAVQNPDGSREAVIEVSNKGRGHLRCKQIANRLQLAYLEKPDQAIISPEDYTSLKDKISNITTKEEEIGA